MDSQEILKTRKNPKMEFEWDENKNRENIQKHGINFKRATKIFNGPVVRWIDNREDYGETRYIAIGRSEGKLLTVVYTMRGIKIRIISARKAVKHERRKYYNTFLR